MKKQQATNKKPTIQQVLKNNKTRTDFRKHEGTDLIRELDREKGNKTTIENTTTTYSTTTTKILNQNSTSSTIPERAGKASLGTERMASEFWDTESAAWGKIKFAQISN